MPTPNKGESKNDFISRCVPMVLEKGTAKDNDQAVAVCNSMFEQSKTKEGLKHRECIRGLKKKEDDEWTYTGLVATTHPDRVGDILSKQALVEIRDHINNTGRVGTDRGHTRGVSLAHDWIRQGDADLDEAGFLKPTARLVELEDGHYGVETDVEVNKYYKGPVTPDEIKYRIENDYYGGMSIEYDLDEKSYEPIKHKGKDYRFIKSFTDFAGVGFARSRRIANPQAVIYKEVEEKIKEGKQMEDEKNELEEKMSSLEEKEKELAEKEKKLESKEKSLSKKEKEELEVQKKELEEKRKELEAKEKEIEKVEEAKLNIKEVLNDPQFKEEFRKALNVENKTLIQKEDKEEDNMDPAGLAIKEMNEQLGHKEVDIFSYKEAASRYFGEKNTEIQTKMQAEGIPLGETNLQVKCDGNKLRLVGQLQSKELQTKDTLDTDTNTNTQYNVSITEFADVFVPAIVETFNQQTNLFGELEKRDHLEGGNTYGWRIFTDQSSTLSVDPDDTTVQKNPASKIKLRTDIKVYREGVSVSDYTLHHSRAAIGDLLMIEVEKRTNDLLKDINGDLFTEQADGDGTKLLGLEAVADSAGNTTLYGRTRSTANRLSPDSATDTYEAVGTALTESRLREGIRAVETEGAMRRNLRIIVHPVMRDAIFNLMDDRQRFQGTSPTFGFDPGDSSVQFMYDGIPVIVDSDCQTDAVFVVDWESYYLVISKTPQMTGLAKVSAAEEAYVETYLAAVYEQPRRIHMIDTTS